MARNPNCTEYVANPASFWRSQPNSETNMTQDIDLERIKIAGKCGTVLLPEYMRSPPPMYDIEIPYLMDPPLNDESLVSNENFSTIVLLNRSSTFALGDTVVFLITVRDGRGRRKTKGGDEVMVWLVDAADRGNSIATRVTDLDNGTYLATTVLAWVGRVRVHAVLAYPREYMQILLTSHVMIKSLFILLGGFVNEKAGLSETTTCSHVPVIMGFNASEICNLTTYNGSPYYCGRPVKPGLTCDHYFHTRLVYNAILPPMTETEDWLLHRRKKVRHMIGSLKLKLRVTKNSKTKDALQVIPDTVCSKVSPKVTWELSRPTGYFYNKKWQSLYCKKSTKFNVKCMDDSQLLFMGDSNSRMHYDNLEKLTQCTSLINRTHKSWHRRLICVDKRNFVMKWLPHSCPFMTSFTIWDLSNWTVAANEAIDDIPSHGRYFVFLNHYFHLTATHMSAMKQMMVLIRESLIRLFAINPNVMVFLQGPHIVWWMENETPYLLGDNINRFLTAVQREVFEDLQDKVIYFPFEDMTMPVQNNDAHPPVGRFLLDEMLYFICGLEG